MALAFQPMLRFYRLSPLWGLALPAIAAAYTLFTVQSAVAVMARPRRHVEGPRPGAWRATPMTRRRRLRLGQGPSRRELSRSPRALIRPRAARRRSWPSTASRAPPTTSPITPTPAPDEKLAQLDADGGRRCAAQSDAEPEGVALRDVAAGPRPADRATRSICSRPSAATSPSCATPTGTS